MTSPTPPPSPTPDPNRPEDAEAAALFDAVAAEHAAIYGYGVVSARVMPDQNDLVSQAVAQHRDRREAAMGMLKERSITAPLPAAGYQLPFSVTGPIGAAKLAVRMESDCAVAWRAVLEQSGSEQDRGFALTALTQSALMAARWRQVLGAWPVTEAFPGGSE
ncbi:MAG TPA: ferritin-like domain-containing protein [Mycobacterium sp.]|uniref:ferritin-like domain-containing protein n=1 Tax=Mycolicibacterium sp. TaxID=2320850 RepID=UPI0025EC5FD0|nr:ferritin-like domain-containing protein [Mycolicibacterium sp.]HPX36261.1 ferritin-like domain-containing protein [Mycobacterium sp.]HQC75174.1 ferritin-like domain-containing protein [Mycobacterium sp.]